MYDLIWNGEVIDSAGTEAEAEVLRSEYRMAFNDYNITIAYNAIPEGGPY